MKAVVFALILLIFNIAMATVTESGLFVSRDFFESEYINQYQNIHNMTNMTKTNIEAPSMDIFHLFTSTLTFDWAIKIGQKIGIEKETRSFVIMLNMILAAIIGIAFIELFMRRSDVLR